MVEPDDSLKRVSFVNFPDEERTSAFLIPWIPAGHRLSYIQTGRPRAGGRGCLCALLRAPPHAGESAVMLRSMLCIRGYGWKNANTFRLRLLSFLVYDLNESFTEALVGTRNLEDLGIAF